jgi:hypothetical protein
MNKNEKFVITINREVGTGGRTVGRKLAEKLGVKYCDKAIVEGLTHKFGLTIERIAIYIIVAMLVFGGMASLTSCSNNDNAAGVNLGTAKSTSLFVATDRHEAGDGNYLAQSLQMIVKQMDVVTPQTVLLGGDYVGNGPDKGKLGQPAFSLDDVRSEIFGTLPPQTTDVLFTYGSHDRNCTDNYGAFFSGPHRCNGYYVYGISYAQMVYDTDSQVQAAVALYEEQGENADESVGPPPEGPDEHGDGERPQPPSDNQQPQRAYNGIDVNDPFGSSAESAAASFTSWVSTLTDHAPIVVMSHVPMHAHRGDNPGGIYWFEALSRAAETHDVILFFGHNHSLEERGDSLDQNYYLLTPGDSISVQGNQLQGVQRRRLGFTYANAGYLKLGWSTLVTFTDTDGNGHYDRMRLRRFSVLGNDDSRFGLTGKRNPYSLRLTHDFPN